MAKVVDVSQFRGVYPGVQERLLGEGDASDAQNCDLRYRDLRGYKCYKKQPYEYLPDASGELAPGHFPFDPRDHPICDFADTPESSTFVPPTGEEEITGNRETLYSYSLTEDYSSDIYRFVGPIVVPSTGKVYSFRIQTTGNIAREATRIDIGEIVGGEWKFVSKLGMDGAESIGYLIAADRGLNSLFKTELGGGRTRFVLKKTLYDSLHIGDTTNIYIFSGASNETPFIIKIEIVNNRVATASYAVVFGSMLLELEDGTSFNLTEIDTQDNRISSDFGGATSSFRLLSTYREINNISIKLYGNALYILNHDTSPGSAATNRIVYGAVALVEGVELANRARARGEYVDIVTLPDIGAFFFGPTPDEVFYYSDSFGVNIDRLVSATGADLMKYTISTRARDIVLRNAIIRGGNLTEGDEQPRRGVLNGFVDPSTGGGVRFRTRGSSGDIYDAPYSVYDHINNNIVFFMGDNIPVENGRSTVSYYYFREAPLDEFDIIPLVEIESRSGSVSVRQLTDTFYVDLDVENVDDRYINPITLYSSGSGDIPVKGSGPPFAGTGGGRAAVSSPYFFVSSETGRVFAAFYSVNTSLPVSVSSADYLPPMTEPIMLPAPIEEPGPEDGLFVPLRRDLIRSMYRDENKEWILFNHPTNVVEDIIDVQLDENSVPIINPLRDGILFYTDKTDRGDDTRRSPRYTTRAEYKKRTFGVTTKKAVSGDPTKHWLGVPQPSSDDKPVVSTLSALDALSIDSSRIRVADSASASILFSFVSGAMYPTPVRNKDTFAGIGNKTEYLNRVHASSFYKAVYYTDPEEGTGIPTDPSYFGDRTYRLFGASAPQSDGSAITLSQGLYKEKHSFPADGSSTALSFIELPAYAADGDSGIYEVYDIVANEDRDRFLILARTSTTDFLQRKVIEVKVPGFSYNVIFDSTSNPSLRGMITMAVSEKPGTNGISYFYFANGRGIRPTVSRGINIPGNGNKILRLDESDKSGRVANNEKWYMFQMLRGVTGEFFGNSQGELRTWARRSIVETSNIQKLKAFNNRLYFCDTGEINYTDIYADVSTGVSGINVKYNPSFRIMSIDFSYFNSDDSDFGELDIDTAFPGRAQGVEDRRETVSVINGYDSNTANDMSPRMVMDTGDVDFTFVADYFNNCGILRDRVSANHVDNTRGNVYSRYGILTGSDLFTPNTLTTLHEDAGFLDECWYNSPDSNTGGFPRLVNAYTRNDFLAPWRFGLGDMEYVEDDGKVYMSVNARNSGSLRGYNLLWRTPVDEPLTDEEVNGEKGRGKEIEEVGYTFRGLLNDGSSPVQVNSIAVAQSPMPASGGSSVDVRFAFEVRDSSEEGVDDADLDDARKGFVTLPVKGVGGGSATFENGQAVEISIFVNDDQPKSLNDSLIGEGSDLDTVFLLVIVDSVGDGRDFRVVDRIPSSFNTKQERYIFTSRPFTVGDGVSLGAQDIYEEFLGASVANAVSAVFRYSYVTDLGEEGALSPVSEPIDVFNGSLVNMENINFPAQERPARGTDADWWDGNITDVSIYVSSDNGFAFFERFPRSDISADGKVSFNYNTGASVIGETSEVTSNYPPPINMRGLISSPNGFLVGFTGNNVVFSLPYLPYAYPHSSRVTVNANIVGLASLGDAILVLTDENPYIFYGQEPIAIATEKAGEYNSCISARSIVNMGSHVMYASPDGIMSIDKSGNQRNVTAGFFREEQFKALYGDYPESVQGFFWNDNYIFFHSIESVVTTKEVPPGSGEFTTIVNRYTNGHIIVFGEEMTIMPLRVKGEVTAGYYDSRTGELFLAIEGVIYKFSGSDGSQSFSWTSKTYTAPRPVSIGAVHVISEKAVLSDDKKPSIRFNLLVKNKDDVFVPLYEDNKNITGSAESRIKTGGFKYNEFKFKVESNNAIVKRIALSEDLVDLTGETA